MAVLTNKVVVITGAFSGLGLALTDLFMQSRCKVVAAGRNTTGALPSYMSNYLPIVRDIRKESDAAEIRDFTLEKFGAADIIVHLAGNARLKPAIETPAPDYERLMVDNYLTAVYVTQAFLPHMLHRQEGSLVFLPGTAGKQGLHGGTAYCASKFALVGYAQSLMEELKPTKIKTTMIYYGLPATGANGHVNGNGQRPFGIPDAAKAIFFAVQQPESAFMSEFVLQPLAPTPAVI